jgi:hypothetical protein
VDGIVATFHRRVGTLNDRTEQTIMALWLVRATWTEDETEASEQWEVNAGTAHDAVREVTAFLRFQPHHVEAKLLSQESKAAGKSSEPKWRPPAHDPSRER